jgi:hypothetical protein
MFEILEKNNLGFLFKFFNSLVIFPIPQTHKQTNEIIFFKSQI